MLSQFRQQKKLLSVFLWLVIAAFIGTIFLVWGVGDEQKTTNYAIKVNKVEIGYDEYKTAYQQTNDTLRQLFGGQRIPEELDLGKQVRDELINKYLLIEEADKMNIPVADAEVLAELMKIPSFNVNGQFDRERYHKILQANRMDAASFEASIAQQIKLNKMNAVINSAVKVTDSEIEKEYLYRNTAATVSFVPLTGTNFQKDVSVDDTKLAAYYENNKENYTVPAKIKVKYISFDPGSTQSDATVSTDEIETYYINNKKDFEQPESVTAQHILIQVNDWDNQEKVSAAEKKINDVLNKVKSGEDFSVLAKTYSEGPSAANDGNLGTFMKGQMVPSFEAAAFALKDGETSNIVKTDFGFHIIKVSKHTYEKLLSLEEAKPIISSKISEELKATSFRNQVLNTYKKILDASNISAYIDAGNTLSVVETELFGITDSVYPLNNDQAAKSALFKLAASEISNILSLNGKQYIFEIMDKKEAFIPEYESIKEAVTSDYVSAEGNELAYQKAESLIALGDIKKISESVNISFSTTPRFKRVEPIPVIGPNSDLSKQIFTATSGKLLEKPHRSNGTSFIISVNELVAPDMTALANEKESISNYLLNLKQSEAYDAYIEKLKSAAVIEINPNLED